MKMRILRVSMSYPRKEMPGIGLSSYYHAYYSKDDNMIITALKEGHIIQNKPEVKVVEVPICNTTLGKLDESILKKTYRLLKKIFSQIMFLLKSIKYIERYKPEIVHVYSPIPILIGLYCRIRFNSGVIMSLHGTDVERIVSSKLLSKLLKIPDAVVAVSNSMRKKLHEEKIMYRIQYMGNGFDKKVFYNKNIKRKDQLINIANLRWQKGQDYLIGAFAKLHEFYPNYNLVIIGDGDYREKLENLVDEFDIGENVVFKGICSRETINDELNISKGFVLSSVIEGSPKVILEAMATGTPVVSTDVGNVRSVVRDCGIIVIPQNVEALYKAMSTIVETSDWGKMSKKAEQYSNEYTWENVGKRLKKIYDEVFTSKHTNRVNVDTN